VRITLNARGADPLKAFADELASGGADVLDVAADVMSPAGCQQVFDRTLERFGQVDILINNAGGSRPIVDGLGSPHEWEDAMRLNFDAGRNLTHALIGTMQAQKFGRIIKPNRK